MSQRTAYGGQAVIEGVMIRGKEKVATAVRLQDGTISVRRDEADSLIKRYPWLRFAFVRGTPALIDSMRLGYRTLMWSADQVMDAAPQSKPSSWQYFLTIFVSLLIGIGVFVLLPTYALKWVFPAAEHAAQSRTLLEQLMPSWSALVPNIAEGVLRVILLIGYVVGISFNPEIRRVFAYHGAEHKVVNAYEDLGNDLTVASARTYSRIHPRCGTSFLFLVFVVGILLHSLFGWQEAWVRVIVRLLMLPLIAGTAYELIRLAGRWKKSLFLKLLVWPGLLLQRLTTAEPTDDQIEVALHSLQTVLQDEGVLKVDIAEPASPSAPATAT